RFKLRRRFDALVFGTTTGVSVQRAGRWFGRINDLFALEEEDKTLVIDQSQGRTFRWPRLPFHVAFHDWIKVRAELGRLLSRGPDEADRRKVRAFIEALKARLPWSLGELFWERTADGLERLAGRLPGLRDGYRRLFDLCRPKILFLEGASYGCEAYIVKWAREMGVKTAEF